MGNAFREGDVRPWLHANGFEFDEAALDFLHQDATGTSVRAKVTLAPKQVVARIPKARCLTRLTCHPCTRELIQHLDALGGERFGYVFYFFVRYSNRSHTSIDTCASSLGVLGYRPLAWQLHSARFPFSEQSLGNRAAGVLEFAWCLWWNARWKISPHSRHICSLYRRRSLFL